MVDVTFVNYLQYFLSDSLSVYERNWISVLNHFFLHGGGKVACRDIDPNPTSSEPSHRSGDVIATGGSVRFLAFCLAKDDQSGF